MLPVDARKRLQTLEEFSDLGEGFKIAMRDLDIRGAGDLLGAEQTGFISDLGFDAYHKILDEAVQELKDTEFKGLFDSGNKDIAEVLVRDCSIETDLEILIPDKYVSSVSERLALYAQLDDLPNESALERFALDIQDRFGPLPEEVAYLLAIVTLKILCRAAHVTHMDVGPKGVLLTFHPSFPHGAALVRIAEQFPAHYKLRPDGKLLWVRSIADPHTAYPILRRCLEWLCHPTATTVA
jgi:transcription-repair coupling factor (superfamily II helicase)